MEQAVFPTLVGAVIALIAIYLANQIDKLNKRFTSQLNIQWNRISEVEKAHYDGRREQNDTLRHWKDALEKNLTKKINNHTGSINYLDSMFRSNSARIDKLTDKVEEHYKDVMTRITEGSEPKKEEFLDTGWWFVKIVNHNYLVWVDRNLYHHFNDTTWYELQRNKVEPIKYITNQPEIIHNV